MRLQPNHEVLWIQKNPAPLALGTSLSKKRRPSSHSHTQPQGLEVKELFARQWAVEFCS